MENYIDTTYTLALFFAIVFSAIGGFHNILVAAGFLMIVKQLGRINSSLKK